MKIEAEIFRISEKTPEQDEFVMVKERGIGYWKPQVFNKECNCWDTADGDDYDCDVDENDVWLRLPSKEICDILQKKFSKE